MKFEFKNSKLANQFFFISNLSEWHFSCRKDYNQEWLKQTGSLTEYEKQILGEFKKIINKYGFNRDKNWKTVYLGQYFYYYSEKKAWQKLEKAVKRKEFNIIYKNFQIFQNRFNKIWDKKELTKRVKALYRVLKLKTYQIFFNELFNFFGNKQLPQKFTIIAVFSPLKGEGVTAAGSANLDNRHIIFEIPKLKNKSWEFEYSIGILAHEISHIFFNQIGGFKIIQKITKELKFPLLMPLNLQPRNNAVEFINELIIELLAPFGYLSQKYFKKFNPLNFVFSKPNLKTLAENFLNFKENKTASAHRLRKFLVWQFYPLIAYQINSKNKIDKKFIKNIIKLTLSIIK